MTIIRKALFAVLLIAVLAASFAISDRLHHPVPDIVSAETR